MKIANSRGDFFGEERLAAILADNLDAEAQELRDMILASVSSFANNLLQDDLTLLVVKKE
jgi:serine phosphatase RsbU (regulator of sigma subunit)